MVSLFADAKSAATGQEDHYIESMQMQSYITVRWELIRAEC